MYLLVAGQVDVLVPVQGDGDHRRATLQPGSVLGEMALLVHGSRSATIVAFSNAVLWQIERRAFEAALKRGDRWAVGLLLEVAKELAGRLSGMSAEFLRLTEELQHKSQPAEPKLAELGRLRQRLFTEWSF
jgi:CRP-like cAMP-binding protein